MGGLFFFCLLNPAGTCLLFALVLSILVAGFSRRTVDAATGRVNHHPGALRMFLYGGAIVALLRLLLVLYLFQQQSLGQSGAGLGSLVFFTVPEVLLKNGALSADALTTALIIVIPLSFLWAGFVTTLVVALRRLARG